MPTVLVVEDDETLRASLLRAFRARGYATLQAPDGLAAMRLVGDADVVVLDVVLPDVDGLTLTRRLRADGDRVPVLLLTARDDVEDRVDGLEAGADDYLPKPFALEELHARTRALVRRTAWDDAGRGADGRDGGESRDGERPERLVFGDLALDTGSMRAARGGDRVELTRTEWALLERFLRNPGRVLRREILLDVVWGLPPETASNVVDVYVGYLRRKLEAGGRPRVIHTVRGVGYVLRDEP